jgi:hypothetical protein
MLDGGHISGYLADGESHVRHIAESLGALLERHGGRQPLLFAVGDGNHSLAAAKLHWQNVRRELAPAARNGHPARFALVELVNIHSEAVKFEPIHRALFNVQPQAVLDSMESYFAARGYSIAAAGAGANTSAAAAADDGAGANAAEAAAEAADDGAGAGSGAGTACPGAGSGFAFPMMWPGHSAAAKVERPAASLPVAELQDFLDHFCRGCPGAAVDYIHGGGELARLVSEEGCFAFELPPIDKHSFFDSVAADGQFPRKAFSMGRAQDKRYYLEARMIVG